VRANVRGCVYCGLPRARVRDRAGGTRALPACSSHVDLLFLDPNYVSVVEEDALELDELLLSLASSSVGHHPRPSSAPAMPP
jgi:hypothetical protein